MGFVIGGFFALALIVCAVWLAAYLYAHRGERLRRSAERAAAERAELLRTPGAQLRCEGCGREFVGPLPEEGCPGCQCAAFVTAMPSAPAEAVAPTAPSEPETPVTPAAPAETEGEPIRVGVGMGGDA